MSRAKIDNTDEIAFIERFVEACDSAEPARIQRLLNISYQAAQNYLRGRLPNARVLRTIAEKTPYSIHWLLTGEGKKFVENAMEIDTLILSSQMKAFVRQECGNVINELLGSQEEAQPKIVVLQSDKLKTEKVIEEESIPLPDKQA